MAQKLESEYQARDNKVKGNTPTKGSCCGTNNLACSKVVIYITAQVLAPNTTCGKF